MADIFISYARPDAAVAETLQEALEREGWTTWRDTAMSAGEHSRHSIERELKAARCVLVLWSPASVTRKWVLAEATAAEEKLVPVLLEEVTLPLPFSETNAARLVGWRGNATAPEYLGLKRSIASMLGGARPAASMQVASRKRRGFAPRLEQWIPAAIMVPLVSAATYFVTSHDEQTRRSGVEPSASLTSEQQQPAAAVTTLEVAIAELGRLKRANESLQAQLSACHKARPNLASNPHPSRSTTPTRTSTQCPGVPLAPEQHQAGVVGDVVILKGAGVMQLYGMPSSKSREKPHVGIKIMSSRTRQPMAQATVFEGQALPFTYCEQKYEARLTTINGQDRVATIAVSSVPDGG